jgi:hypothetical protein
MHVKFWIDIETALGRYKIRVRFQNYSSLKAESKTNPTKHAWYPPFRFLINKMNAIQSILHSYFKTNPSPSSVFSYRLPSGFPL